MGYDIIGDIHGYAEPLKALDFTALKIATRPDAAAMIDAIGDLVDRLNRVEGGSGPQ